MKVYAKTKNCIYGETSKSLKSSKGFTLVELIVVLVIFSIAIGLVGMGMLSWQDWTDFNNQNEYAQTIFIAAQNQLNEYNSNGRIKELQEEIDIEHNAVGKILNVTTLISEDGDYYDLDNVWPESKNESNPDKYRGDIISLRAQPGDYDSYINNPDSYRVSNPEQFWLFELVSPYIADPTILNDAAVCIEFTPSDGQVFSVLYSAKNSKFEYNSSNTSTRGTVDISNRTEDYREDRMIGYYGVDTLYLATMSTKNPAIASAHIYNDSTCYLSFQVDSASVSNDYRAVNQMTYVVDVYGNNSGDLKMTLIIDGSQLPYNGNEKVVTCSVYKYDADGNKVEAGNFPVICRLKNVWTVEVVLDAADIQAQSSLYASELNKIKDAGNMASAVFAKTYSYFRFGLDTEDVYCLVKGTGYIKDTEQIATDNHENPVFASGEKTDNNWTFGVSNGRHLYNIRYVEDISYAEEGSITGETINSVRFNIASSIDWQQFQIGGNLYNSDAGYFQLGDSLNRYNCPFPSIGQLRNNDVIDGQGSDSNASITGINITYNANVLYKMYVGKDSKPTSFINENNGTISNLALINESVTGSNIVGGVVGVNNGSISNLFVSNGHIEGDKLVGGVAGVNAGSVDQLSNDAISVVDGEEYVGGIIGFQLPKSDSIIIQNLTNNATVTGKKAVGGIVSMLRNDIGAVSLSDLGLSSALINKTPSVSGAINVSNCVNNGLVSGETTDSMYIGGITGYCYNKVSVANGSITISNCESTFTKTDLNMADKDALNQKLLGIYVGGITGYNYRGLITECSTGENGNILGYKYVGGIVGLNIGSLSGTGAGTNASDVIGKMYVGGITGCNSYTGTYENGNTASSLDPEEMGTNILAPSKNVYLYAKIDNWSNEGVVLATGSYAGGITGYNTGWIYGCNSNIDTSRAASYMNNVKYGDYVGGIAGYSNGIIGNSNRNITTGGAASTVVTNGSDISVVSCVRGANYLGGIVGYNDINSIVENYKVTGGTIIGSGESCFVGGYAGFNASMDLLMNPETKEARLVESNPSYISGGYFVGGTIGGNIVNTNGFKPVAPIINKDIISEIKATLEQDEKINANFEFNSNQANPNIWGGNGQPYTTEVKLVVHNDTDKLMYSWRAVFKPVNGKFPTFNTYGNHIWDEEFQSLRNANTGNAYIPAHDSITLTFQISADTRQELIDFVAVNSNVEIFIFNPENNMPGVYWGVSEYKSDVYYGINQYNDSNSSLFNGQLVLVNKTTHVLPNWRLEMACPNGVTVVSIDSRVNYTIENGYIIFTGSSDASKSLPGNNGNIYANVQLQFNSAEDCQNFYNQVPILTFNNVVYMGEENLENGQIGSGLGGSGSSGGNGGSGSGNGNQSPLDNLSDEGVIETLYRADAFTGELVGKAFAGGFMGYNLFVNSNTPNDIYAVENAIITNFKSSNNGTFNIQSVNAGLSASNSDTEAELLRQKTLILDYISSLATYSATDDQFTIRGVSALTEGSANISAQMYAAGVIGYNDPGTYIYFKDVQNNSVVSATKPVARPEEQIVNGAVRATNYAESAYTYNYAYAGGIVGKAGKNTVLDNCKNANAGNISSAGTYLGTLAEVNEGIIINCNVPFYSNTERNYVGGLCGLNKATGIIDSCSMDSQHISGGTVVGGITAENFGKISNITLSSASLLANTGVGGLYAGYNGVTGEIKLEKNIEGTVTAYGDYAGIVVGYNTGILKNEKTKTTASLSDNLEISGTVTGYKSVGSLAGYYSNGKETDVISNITNRASVTATNGNAGGIFGYLESGNSIKYCANYGTVSASTEGNAGGIAGTYKAAGAENFEYVSNYGLVSGTEYVGGIFGNYKNNNSGMTIKYCQNHGNITASFSKSEGEVGLGGFIGAINDSSANCLVEECVNTGLIIRNDSNDSVYGKCSGDFVGKVSGSASCDFKYCQNYNTYNTSGSNMVNGFVGEGSDVVIAFCFDNSGMLDVKRNVTTPFGDATLIGNYYCDRNSIIEFNAFNLDNIFHDDKQSTRLAYAPFTQKFYKYKVTHMGIFQSKNMSTNPVNVFYYLDRSSYNSSGNYERWRVYSALNANNYIINFLKDEEKNADQPFTLFSAPSVMLSEMPDEDEIPIEEEELTEEEVSEETEEQTEEIVPEETESEEDEISSEENEESEESLPENTEEASQGETPANDDQETPPEEIETPIQDESPSVSENGIEPYEENEEGNEENPSVSENQAG